MGKLTGTIRERRESERRFGVLASLMWARWMKKWAEYKRARVSRADETVVKFN